MRYHRFCKMIPLPSEEEFEDLKEDIDKNGLHNPITIFNGEILDGRSRSEACKQLGIPIKTKGFRGTEEQALAFVVSLNLYRRHLEPSQKACVASRMVRELERLKGMDRTRAIDEAIKVTGAGKRTVEKCLSIAVKEPEIFNDILRGAETVGHYEKIGKPVKICPMCKRRL